MSQTTTFGYDRIGNMLFNGESGSQAYSYGVRMPHAVKLANGKRYAYDANGNMIVRDSQRLAYDLENRLSTVTATNAVTRFGYDGNGARLWKSSTGTNGLQVWIGGNYEEKQGKVLFHILVGDRLVCTFEKAGATFDYYHPDHLHSTAVLSDPSGNLTQHYEYSAFGQDRYTYSSTAFPVSKRYTSQVLDEDTGLYFYGARYYAPELARFIQPDDILPDFSDPQSYNRYSYALNNPLRYTDPSGHGAGEVVGDALLNADTIKSSYQLITMPDSLGWKLIEVPVGIGGIAVGVADAAFDAATLGGKGVLMGTAKEGIRVGLEAATKSAVKETSVGLAKQSGKETARALRAATEGAESEAKLAKGGTYKLAESESGKVKRTGQTSDLKRRGQEHARGEDTKDLKFQVDRRTDSYAERRGREQVIYDRHPEARVENGGLNKQRPISPTNPNKQRYLDAAKNVE